MAELIQPTKLADSLAPDKRTPASRTDSGVEIRASRDLTQAPIVSRRSPSDRPELNTWSAAGQEVVESPLCSVMRPGTLTSMPMPNSLAKALRHALMFLGLLAAVGISPVTASADAPPRTKRAAVAASKKRQKPVASSSRASRRARLAVRSSRRGRLAVSRRSRRGRARQVRYAAPVIPNVAQASFVSDSADRLRDSIVSLARQQIGTPYVWGAETPGRAFDCSGLVKYVMSWFNVALPRTAHEQSYSGIRVGRELNRMKPGDLLTFGTARHITHIGFYSGNGRYVHASRPGVGVVESVLNPSAARFRGAIRLVADADTLTTKAEAIP
jgi:cell wall-associated NlpC family hydrolase